MEVKKSLPHSKLEVLVTLFQSLFTRSGVHENKRPQQFRKRAKESFAVTAILFLGILVTFVDHNLPWNFVCRVRQTSGELYQWTWNGLLDVIGDDAFCLFVYGSSFLTIGLYWFIGMIYVLIDMTGKPQWIRKYKVQPGTNEPLDPKRFISVIGQILFNQFFVGFPGAFIGFWVMDACGGIPADIRQLPSLGKIVLDLTVFALCEEVVFYYSHRLLHHRRLYKYIHKRHHEWQSPIAVTAVYCHPIEHVLSNLSPVIAGPVLMGSHLSITWLWFTYAIVRTLNDHSGYHLPGFPSPEAHDYHHLKFTECFGFCGILDYLHGTDVNFRATPSYLRHAMSLKLEPVRSLFPDKDVQPDITSPTSNLSH